MGDTHVILVFDPEERLLENEFLKLANSLEGFVDKGIISVAGRGRLYFIKTSVLPVINLIRESFPDFKIEWMEAVLPVITSSEKKEQFFDSFTKWKEVASAGKQTLYAAAVQYEINASAWTEEKIMDYMKMIERKMYRQTHVLYEEKIAMESSPFFAQNHLLWLEHVSANRVHSGRVISDALKLALAVNAKVPGVEIVPGPMGTGGGYLYSALFSVKESKGYTDADLLRGLFIAAGVGAIAYTGTFPTGEVIGCAGECGVCSAMTAAAITEMAGGDPEQVESAASYALQAFIGIPCDPVPGGFEQPCLSRIITAICMAITFSDMALAGCSAFLPFDEVLTVADKVGRELHSDLRCTSKGGCCSTSTAIKQKKEFEMFMKSRLR